MRHYRVTWGVRHRSHGDYVVKHENDRPHHVIYGPMPAAVVIAFIAERRALFEEIINRQLNKGKPNG